MSKEEEAAALKWLDVATAAPDYSMAQDDEHRATIQTMIIKGLLNKQKDDPDDVEGR